MSEVVYRSNVRIERVKGPIRKAYLPVESQPVIFGVHGAVAEHYKVPPNVWSHVRLHWITSSQHGRLTYRNFWRRAGSASN